jgi:SNF2 family DNA or RNA helicase
MAIIPLAQEEQYEPSEWQEEDIEYLLSVDDRANWSEMGCRKTTTALWLAERFCKGQEENPNVLIVTTKSGKGTYRDATPKSVPDWRVFNVTTKDCVILGPYELEEKYDIDYLYADLNARVRKSIVLAHYHCFVNKSPMFQLLKEVEWDVIICDEAHRIKNRKTQWTRNLKQLKCNGMKHVMTGTGFINDPSEMWSLLNFLNRVRFPSYWKFREYYCLEEDYTGFRKVTGINPQHLEEFRNLRSSLGPRRTMKEVYSEIDEPIETPIDVELNAIQRRMYNEIKRDLYALDQQNVPIYSPNVLSQLSRLRQIAVATPEKVREYYDPKLERRVQVIRLVEPSSKLDALMEVVEGLQWDDEEKQQLVVFSNFKDPLELAKVRLDKAGISYIHMVESDSDAKRYDKWHNQWPMKEHRVFLSTLQLGSESINLSSAQHVVFLDRSWSPKDMNQGVSRLYRPGQTGKVNVIHINAVKTVDKRMLETLQRKGSWFKEIFGNE